MVCVYSCAENDFCSGERIGVDTLDDFGCQNNSTANSVILTSAEFILVRNQEDFESMVMTLCSSTIDWSEYDLIAGNLQVEETVTDIRPFVSIDCSTNTVKVEFEILTSNVQDPSEITFSAFIPKLENDQELFVNFE